MIYYVHHHISYRNLQIQDISMIYHDSFIPDYVHLHSLMNVVFELGLYPKMLQFYAEFMSS